LSGGASLALWLIPVDAGNATGNTTVEILKNMGVIDNKYRTIAAIEDQFEQGCKLHLGMMAKASVDNELNVRFDESVKAIERYASLVSGETINLHQHPNYDRAPNKAVPGENDL